MLVLDKSNRLKVVIDALKKKKIDSWLRNSNERVSEVEPLISSW